MNLKLGIFICIIAILALVVPAAADNSTTKDNNTATVYGRVYSMVTFEPMDNAVVEINSIPYQSMVATYGVYSFELAPGNYTITAKYYQNSTVTYSVDDTVNIINKGTYVRDLLLLPVYSEELMSSSSSNGSSNGSTLNARNSTTGVSTIKINNTKATNATSNSGFYTPSTSYLLIALLTLFLLSAAGYQLFGNHKKREKSSSKEKTAHNSKDFPSPANTHEPSLKTSVTESVKKSEFVRPEEKGKVESGENLSTQETELLEPESKVETLGTSLEKPEVNPEIDIQEPKKKLPLPSDLQEVIDIIRGQRGRITQKELCGRLKCSDAKVSLMLADLERRNLIEKFKKGRGNVVTLKDKGR